MIFKTNAMVLVFSFKLRVSPFHKLWILTLFCENIVDK